MEARENRQPTGLSQRTWRFYAVILLGNTVMMIGAIGLVYAFLFADLSTNEKILVIVPYLAIAYGWTILLKRMGYGRRRSN
jgi:hypothetical protein